MALFFCTEITKQVWRMRCISLYYAKHYIRNYKPGIKDTLYSSILLESLYTQAVALLLIKGSGRILPLLCQVLRRFIIVCLIFCRFGYNRAVTNAVR